MTLTEYAKMVRQMRQCQKLYFESRGKPALLCAKEQERNVDKATDAILAPPSLFDKDTNK
jgi:hypothetical protein